MQKILVLNCSFPPLYVCWYTADAATAGAGAGADDAAYDAAADAAVAAADVAAAVAAAAVAATPFVLFTSAVCFSCLLMILF